MTGNKFSGEICAYCCTEPSTTDDHVVARGFFVEAQRGNLPQVPACASCNGEKNRLEMELMVELGFGGRHDDALENLSGQVARRIENKANARTARAIREGVEESWIVENEVIRKATSVPINWTKIERLCAYIARGLAWHHFDKLVFGPEHAVQVASLAGLDAAWFRRFRTGKTQRLIEGNLGNGTFSYWVAQALDKPHLTVWEFSIYGGIRTKDSGDEPSNVWVITGPRAMTERAALKREQLAQWREGTRLHRG